MTPADVLALMDAAGMPPLGPPTDPDNEVREHLLAAAAVLRAATCHDAEEARIYLDVARHFIGWAISILDEIDGRE